MADEAKLKWEGKATAELKASTVEQIWPFIAEFCNLEKFFPTVHTCYRKEGTPGQPGLVRYCESKDGWADEKLLSIDPINHSMSYEVMENNLGFINYIATLDVLPTEGDGCKIEWSFVSDPIEGMKLEDLVSYIDDCLHFMAKKMEEAAHGKAMAELKSSTTEQTWPFLAEFCNLDKFNPSSDTCYREGLRVSAQSGPLLGRQGRVSQREAFNHLSDQPLTEL
ncbi:hypothetical protein GQ457_08G003880 [Hibiscus cannabinus]